MKFMRITRGETKGNLKKSSCVIKCDSVCFRFHIGGRVSIRVNHNALHVHSAMFPVASSSLQRDNVISETPTFQLLGYQYNPRKAKMHEHAIDQIKLQY